MFGDGGKKKCIPNPPTPLSSAPCTTKKEQMPKSGRGGEERGLCPRVVICNSDKIEGKEEVGLIAKLNIPPLSSDAAAAHLLLKKG